MPVIQSISYEFILNRRMAKRLDLAIAPAFLAGADEAIESLRWHQSASSRPQGDGCPAPPERGGVVLHGRWRGAIVDRAAGRGSSAQEGVKMSATRDSIAACVLAALSAAAGAATSFDLATDFSNAANPNGAWSFTQGATALTHFATPVDSNPFNASAGDGYWGVGPNFSIYTPEVVRTTADGTASGQTTEDWKSGDVVIHSTNPGTGAQLLINWTAPADGVIDYSILAWYAHSAVNRSNDVLVTLDGTLIGSGTVGYGLGYTRSTALTFSGTGVAVDAGDVLAVSFVAAPGQVYGSLAGIGEGVVFTPAIPEPATWALWLGGALLLLATSRRRMASTAAPDSHREA